MPKLTLSWCLFSYALATNAVWEFVQCAVFYDMWSWSIERAAVWMAGAILADGVLVLLIVGLAGQIIQRRPISSEAVRWLLLIFTGLCVGVAVEWIAKSLALWKYGTMMPEFHLFGQTLGLTPLLQMALLPALSVYCAARREQR